MKMAVMAALRKIKNGGKDGDEEMNPARELTHLATEMQEVEGKLRDDRHDMGVQGQGTQIENRLVTLIETIDQSSSSASPPSSGDKKKDQQGKKQQTGGQANNGKSGGSPLQESKLGAAAAAGATNAATVAGKQDAWAKLPPAQRDELLQAYREEIPERWRKRLEAYFFSIATDEAKHMDE